MCGVHEYSIFFFLSQTDFQIGFNVCINILKTSLVLLLLLESMLCLNATFLRFLFPRCYILKVSFSEMFFIRWNGHDDKIAIILLLLLQLLLLLLFRTLQEQFHHYSVHNFYPVYNDQIRFGLEISFCHKYYHTSKS